MEEILIAEAHNYFLSSYPNKIEDTVLGELSLWIENHFEVKVKKIAFLESGPCKGKPVKRLEVFIYYKEDFMRLSPMGIITWGKVAEANSKLILNSAWEIIRKHTAENYFANLEVVTLRSFEEFEVYSIVTLMFRDEIENIRAFLVDDIVKKVWIVSPFYIIMLFFKSKGDADAFHNSGKRRELDLMLYKMAKPRDLYDFITSDTIKKFYAYTNIENFAPNCDFRHYELY